MGNTYNLISWAGWILTVVVLITVGVLMYFDVLITKSEIYKYSNLRFEFPVDSIYVNVSEPDHVQTIDDYIHSNKPVDIIDEPQSDNVEPDNINIGSVITIDTSSQDDSTVAVVYDDYKVKRVFKNSYLSEKSKETEYLKYKIGVISKSPTDLISEKIFIKWNKIDELYENRYNNLALMESNKTGKMNPLIKYTMWAVDAVTVTYITKNILDNKKISTQDYIAGGLVLTNIGFTLCLD